MPKLSTRTTLLVASVLAVIISGIDVLANGASLFDLAVYRQGGSEVLHGTGRLYDFQIQVYPFTYPPFAALVLVPMALLPLAVVKVGWTVLCAPTLVAVWWATFRAAGRTVPTGWWFVLPVSASAFLLDPVSRTIHFGQVNLVLLLVLLLDLLGPVGDRWRGVLTGLAAAFKLTPLAFLVFLALTRQWRALRNAAAAFVGAAALGFAVLPHESWRYWTVLVRDSSRIGPIERATNQSVMGTLVRLGAERDTTGTTLLWLLIAGALGCASMALAVLCWRRDEELLAVSLVGLVALFASPISWTHHWVWCIPLGVGLATAVRRWTGSARRGWIAAGLWWSVFVAAPQRRLPRGNQVELGWSPWQHMVGTAYVWASVLLLAYVAVLLVRHREPATRQVPDLYI